MSGSDSVNDVIQASLKNFMERLEEVSSDQFNEMRKCSFFDPVPSQWLAEISKVSKTVTFAPGEHITTEHDATETFYVIIFGTATVYLNQNVVGTIRSGECVGEGAFFTPDSVSRMATVIADGEVIAVEITKMNMSAIEGETRTCLNKALLLALHKKLQFANHKIEQLLQANRGFS